MTRQELVEAGFDHSLVFPGFQILDEANHLYLGEELNGTWVVLQCKTHDPSRLGFVSDLMQLQRFVAGFRLLEPEPPKPPTLRERVIEVLTDITKEYCDLANSGDAGFWDPEEVDSVKAARKLLAELEKGGNP